MFSLPPSASFLDELASGLIEATGARERPDALADALIFTPNRRAARELALALFRVLGASPIAPDIRALGDADEEDSAATIGADALGLPPALSPARRRGALARLIQGWRRAQEEPDLPPGSALAAADELAGLLDQATIGDGVDWDQLKDLSLSADLAEHWRVSAGFLDIVAKAWPAYLAEQGAADPIARRRQAADALAARWAMAPPQHPVVIAGSTGAASATRILMKAVLQLPGGVVVLPGLDPDLDAPGWRAVGRAPSHPQFTLKETLDMLGAAPADVRMWHVSSESEAGRARRRLVNEALAPAESTKGWNERLKHLASPGSAQELVEAGLAGLTLIEADDESEEALVAALLLRETLESGTETAALVTPEAAVGRRVAAILQRWGVEVGPSSGTPLHRTRSGGFLLLVMRWARDPADPVLLLALLKHALTGLNREPQDLQRIVSALELAALRGPRLDDTLDELAARLVTPRDQRTPAQPEASALVRELAAHHQPFAETFAVDAIDGAAASEACARLAMAIAATPASPSGDRVWKGKSGAMAAQFVEQLRELCAEMGPVDAALWPDFAEAVARRMVAAPETPEHPRIAIWGPLEARLQRRDRMILAGLNEGAWPKAAPVDAFLNRSLRKKIGLPDPDERIGLSAHDFAQMANAPDVVLLRARRVDDKPAVASRWLWRLRTLAAGGLGGQAAADAAFAPAASSDAIAWARALRTADRVTPASPPAPRPPADKRRLNRFSPSRAVTLIRDPYADFARQILGLERLRLVGEDIDARERGTAVHAAIEDHAKSGGALPLERLIVEKLLAAGASRDLIELERPLWLRAARVYLAWAADRAPRVSAFELEKEGVLTFASPTGDVRLKAKADRIEKLTDGTLAIIDFKTGQPKSAKQVLSGLEPQLALEAAIAAHVAFGGIGPAQTSELIYFQLSTGRGVTGEKNGEPLDFRDADKNPVDTRVVAEEALAGLQRMIAAYADPQQPYLSRPRVFSVKLYGEYDRLARRDEWTVEEGEE